MPVSHKFEINISIIGFKADVGYGSSVKYVEVRPNISLEKPKVYLLIIPAEQLSVKMLLTLLFPNPNSRSTKFLKKISYRIAI
jgi:hypothetical protein